MIGVIAVNQLRMLSRERIFLAILAALLLMTVLAGFIGWSSHNTIVRVYEESARCSPARASPRPLTPST